MDKIESINIPAESFELQTFTPEDVNLIPSQEVEVTLNIATDTVEYFLYDENKQLLVEDYNYTGWRTDSDSTATNTNNTVKNVELKPEEDVLNITPYTGRYYPYYNFVSNKFLSSTNSRFYIDSISSDRTEIVVKTNNLTSQELVSLTSEFTAELNAKPYFQEFYLNFGKNQSIIGLDLQLLGETLQIKLYEPLPSLFKIKSTFWIQLRIANPEAYQVSYTSVIKPVDTSIKLKGPNYTLVTDKLSKSANTEFSNKEELTFTNSTGSRAQLASLLQQKGIELNTDYTEYSNFVHFSSATQRLQNFYYKASLIESYQNDINIITGSNTPATQQSQSISTIQTNIDRIITNFDGYDYYLYYESGSTSWPKTNSTPPYTLASTGSAAVLSWYGTEGLDGTGQLQSASIYDSENQDNLVYSIPEYLREDSNNAPGELFVEMIGQHFDNLYLYTEAITSKYNADNRLDYGISKDLVADTLRSFGVKLYENNFSTDDLYTALIGLTPSGSTLPLPNISTVFPVIGEGNEYIETIISASSDVIPLDDLNKSVYKRLYHNLPALVKKKGTLDGLRLLINSFGIPDTILRISEFGGKDKVNANDWDYWQHDFNYKYELDGQNDSVRTEWALNSNWNANNDRPAALAFRFSTDEVTTSAPTNVSQSLWWSSTAPPSFTTKYSAITLTYTGSAGTSGSYSGSVVDPYYQYGTLTFFPNYADTTVSASVYLPFFDGGWWSVLVNSGSDGTYTLYAKNSIYNGNTGTTLGFQASSSVTPGTNTWISGSYSVFGNSVDTYSNLSGSLQEIRYYTNTISESVFDDYVMNPASFEGNSINSSPDELAFRGALGNELYTGSVSIHPKVSGTEITSSFSSNSTITFTGGTFTSDTEYRFLDQPVVGIRNRISDKIRTADSTVYGTTLSSLRSLEQNTPSTRNYTRDVNYLEVGFSPQNEINDDIIGQIGFFNMGDYIGDPRQISSSAYSYPALDTLRGDYFKKYTSSYNLQDYLRLIKFFDNSLFKMVKDFIPARTGAATGAIVKQHLLERNRQRPAQLTFTQPEYTASIEIETFSGGPGGVMDPYQTSNQAWTASILTKAGLVTEIHSDRSELFNGELSGSTLYPQLQYEINTTPLLNNVSSSRLSTFYEDVDYTTDGYRPVNFNFITASIAFKAPVQDSNYSSGSVWNISRYEGTKNSGQKNTSILFASTSIAPGYPIDDFTDWFAYYDWVGSSNPEYPNGGNFHIVNLINARTGEILGLSAKNNYLSLVSNIFKQGQTPTQIVSTFGSIETSTDLVIETGGATYQTILAKTGSASDAHYISYGWNSGSFYTGKIASITVVDGGDYTSTPTVTIDPPTGPGTTATATATLVGTVVTAITLTNSGSGYTSVPNVTFSGGTPSAYSASAIAVLEDIIPTYPNPYLYNGLVNNVLEDFGVNGGATQGWAAPLFTQSFASYGTATTVVSNSETIQIYNKRTGELVSGREVFGFDIPVGVNYEDTLLPLTTADFIRVGYDSTSPAVDSSFEGAGLYRITDRVIGTPNNVGTDIYITPTVYQPYPNGKTVQNFRIMRRVPNETFVLVKEIPANTGAGLLIPSNFNPAYDPIEIAKQQNLLA